MSQLSPKLKTYGDNPLWKSGRGYEHWCPACKTTHEFAVQEPFRNGAKWTFDGNVDAPTLTPSMNIRIGPYPDDNEHGPGWIEVCHYFLRGGVIQYLTDCTHEMKGQNVPLPDLPLHLWDADRRKDHLSKAQPTTGLAPTDLQE